MANARCMRAAQVQARGLLFTAVPSRPAASGAVEGAVDAVVPARRAVISADPAGPLAG